MATKEQLLNFIKTELAFRYRNWTEQVTELIHNADPILIGSIDYDDAISGVLGEELRNLFFLKEVAEVLCGPPSVVSELLNAFGEAYARFKDREVEWTLANANFNRPDRDHAKHMPVDAWFDLSTIESQ